MRIAHIKAQANGRTGEFSLTGQHGTNRGFQPLRPRVLRQTELDLVMVQHAEHGSWKEWDGHPEYTVQSPSRQMHQQLQLRGRALESSALMAGSILDEEGQNGAIDHVASASPGA